ncbi:MAG: thermonuclease family protein [Planctomycetes bacterium]|nr:thermonuclease family protein [Planctomycetota bacterium]
MSRRHRNGRLHTGRTGVLMVVAVLLLGTVLYYSGILPFRLRPDGIYGGNAESAPACAAAVIERPPLYLPRPDNKRSGYVIVTRVIDGDTIEIDRGKGESIRLIGVDCDEVGRDKIDPESFGWQAAMWVFEQMEPDAQVRLRYDDEREDKYGRTLAYVYLPDGRMLNEELLKQGWARIMRIPPNTRHADEFKKLQAEARDKGAGRWR